MKNNMTQITDNIIFKQFYSIYLTRVEEKCDKYIESSFIIFENEFCTSYKNLYLKVVASFLIGV